MTVPTRDPVSRARRPPLTLMIMAAAVGFALLDAAVTSAAHWHWVRSEPFGALFLGLLPPWLLLGGIALAVGTLSRRFPIHGPHRARAAVVHVAAALATPLVHLTALHLVHRLQSGTAAGDPVRVISDLVAVYFAQDVAIYAALATAFHLADYQRRLRDRERIAAELEASLAEARLAALRHQLSPHFLFNALNTVAMLIRQDRPADALSTLAALGDLLRHLLRTPVGLEVTLGEELDFIERYLELEHVRFHDRLEVRFDVDPSVRDARVPSLILQPLVENAVRHGISRRAAAGRIEIAAGRDGSVLRLTVRDNGPGLGSDGDPARDQGVGLRNTRTRLAQLHGAAARLSVISRPEGGVAAEVVLPFRAAARPEAVGPLVAR